MSSKTASLYYGAIIKLNGITKELFDEHYLMGIREQEFKRLSLRVITPDQCDFLDNNSIGIISDTPEKSYHLLSPDNSRMVEAFKSKTINTVNSIIMHFAKLKIEKQVTKGKKKELVSNPYIIDPLFTAIATVIKP